MKTKAIIIMLVLLSVVSLSLATNSNSIIDNDIEYYIQTDKSVYNLGEDVEMLFRVSNLIDEDIRFDYMGPLMDFIVEEDNGEYFTEIWHWSWDQIYPDGPRVFWLLANESVELDGVWPQINLNGSVEIEDHTPVPPGTYRISGLFTPTDISVAVDVTVIPEPGSLSLMFFCCFYTLRTKKRTKC